MTNGLFGKMMVIGFAIATVGIGVVANFLASELPPTVASTRRVMTPEVRRGDMFILQNGLPQETNCASTVYRSIYDSAGRRIFSESEYRPGAGELGNRPAQALRALPIISQAALGPAEYAVTVSWECNAVQRIWPQIRTLPVLKFEIVP